MSWSLGPNLAQPTVYESTDATFEDAEDNLDFVIARDEYEGDYQKLLEDVAPTCTEFIHKCKVKQKEYTGSECCGKVFNSKPIINQYGKTLKNILNNI